MADQPGRGQASGRAYFTLKPNMEGYWVGWLVGVEPAK